MVTPVYPRPPGARKRSQSPKSSPDAQYGYVTSFDGTKLFYSVEGQGKPLVFCYGIVCSSLHWTYQIEYFKKNYRTIWFDYRGHQNSDLPKDMTSLTVDNILQDVKAICDQLGVTRGAAFLGHSMGVNVVLGMAHRYPELVGPMVLANGTAKRPLETLFANNVMRALFEGAYQLYRSAPSVARKLWTLQRGNPLVQSMIGISGFNPHLTPREDVARYIDQMSELDPGVLLHLIHDYNNCDATPWLHTLAQPTLLIGGERDQIIPIDQQELMHQLIPTSELQRIRHGSHCPQMDLPDQINLLIERFLKRSNY